MRRWAGRGVRRAEEGVAGRKGGLMERGLRGAGRGGAQRCGAGSEIAIGYACVCMWGRVSGVRRNGVCRRHTAVHRTAVEWIMSGM